MQNSKLVDLVRHLQKISRKNFLSLLFLPFMMEAFLMNSSNDLAKHFQTLTTPVAAFERLGNWGCSQDGNVTLKYHGQHTGQTCIAWNVQVEKVANQPSTCWVKGLDIAPEETVSFRLRGDVQYILLGMEDTDGKVGLQPNLPAIAPNIWNEIRLCPAALPVMGHPELSLGRVRSIFFITQGGAGELPWSGNYSYHFDCMRFANESDSMADNPPGIPPNRPAFDEVELLPEEEFVRRWESVKQKLDQMETKLEEVRSEGRKAHYETASLSVVRCLIDAPMDDFKNDWIPRRATKMLLFYEQCLKVTEERLGEILSGEREVAEVPEPSLAQMSIGDGMFFAGGQPVLLTGLMGWGLDSNLSLFQDLGFNFISMETGLKMNFPEEGVAQKDENVLNHLREAKAHNFAMDLLVSPHYRPQWIDENFPGVDIDGQRRARGHFTNWNVSDPDFKRICAEYATHLMSYLKDAPHLVSIDLSNEVWYDFAADYPLEDFQNFLKDHYRNLNELNARWGTDFQTWEEANICATSGESWLDFNNYNQDRVTRWYADFSEAFGAAGCKVPTYCKVVGNAYEVMGVEKDKFSEALDACGADCFPRHDPEGLHLASDFREQQTIIDLYKSCYPEKAIIDTEYHINHYWIPVSAGHIKSMMWDGAVHGRSAAGVWVWGRNLENPEHSLMNQPWCFEALAHSSLDLRRFAGEVHALANIVPEIALIYRGTDYMKWYEELYFTGLPFRLLTDRRITVENLDRFKVVVAPSGAAVSDSAAEALACYAENGGRIIAGPSSLRYDLYNKECGDRPVLEMIETFAAPEPESESKSSLRRAFENGEYSTRPLKLLPTGEDRSYITWRATEYRNSTILFAINYGRETCEVLVKCNDKNRPDRGVNLLSDSTVTDRLLLRPLEPVLVRY